MSFVTVNGVVLFKNYMVMLTCLFNMFITVTDTTPVLTVLDHVC